VDVTDEKAVAEFIREYNLQYGDLDALAMIVGGFAMGGITDTSQNDLDQQLKLNFFSTFHLVKGFLPTMKNQKKGTLLFVGAMSALEADGAVGKVAYSLSKKLIFDFVEILGEETKKTSIRSHIFVPGIIDTPTNRESMPDADFTKWVAPKDIAETMHFAVNTASLQNTIFKLYGEV
jgi:NAD(P)-dependent dehydrogenase (short-subunit alcohol dehydrogenase family)